MIPPEGASQGPKVPPDRTLVTLATYQERDNIEPLLDAILAVLPDADVLVIDDASPDGTGALVDAYGAKDPRVRALHRPGKLGLGTATMDAMRHAIQHRYGVMVNMDADFSHPPQNLPDLLAGMADHDVMIGSRYVPGGGIKGWGMLRKFMSGGINWYSRLLLRLPVRDCSGAFRCYRVTLLERIDFDRVYSKGYSFQEEFLYHCRCAGARIGETPIVFEDRKRGKSKINWKECWNALWALLITPFRPAALK